MISSCFVDLKMENRRTATGYDAGIIRPNTVSLHFWSGSGNTVRYACLGPGQVHAACSSASRVRVNPDNP